MQSSYLSRQPKDWVLSLQHVVAMFGSTVLVPILTGLDPTMALLGAGLGTLLFHLVTKGIVPVYLGSSFAFIAPIIAAAEGYGPEYALTGIMIAGLIYLAMSVIIFLIGTKLVKRLFPPIITGPTIIVIGLTLAPVAIDNASKNWLVALTVLAVVVITSVFFKGFLSTIPVLLGVTAGYLICLPLELVNTQPIKEAPLLALPPISFLTETGAASLMDPNAVFIGAPAWAWGAVLIVAPVAIVSIMEHIGDIVANGAVVKQDFMLNPGLHRTMLGDGLATLFGGLIGAPPNTTYSENTGVLALTQVFDPRIIRGAALIAVILSFAGKLGAVLRTIPAPVMGGVSIILFGMIASVGLRSTAKVDFDQARNLIIASVILVMGIGGAMLDISSLFGLQAGSVSFAGMSLGAIFGIIFNIILPEKAED